MSWPTDRAYDPRPRCCAAPKRPRHPPPPGCARTHDRASTACNPRSNRRRGLRGRVRRLRLMRPSLPAWRMRQGLQGHRCCSVCGCSHSGSHVTRRWREMDSNHRYPRERSLLLPRSKLARRNRLAAGTGCRLQRAKVSAYSNVSNGAEREPPILRISLLAGANARRAGSAGGRSQPCSPNIPRCARSRPNRSCSPGCGPRSRLATGT
jgi:hypothetical protein